MHMPPKSIMSGIRATTLAGFSIKTIGSFLIPIPQGYGPGLFLAGFQIGNDASVAVRPVRHIGKKTLRWMPLLFYPAFVPAYELGN